MKVGDKVYLKKESEFFGDGCCNPDSEDEVGVVSGINADLHGKEVAVQWAGYRNVYGYCDLGLVEERKKDKKKYNVIFDFDGDRDTRYRVNVKEHFDTRKVVVKERTIGLYPEHHNKKIVEMEVTPNLDVLITVNGQSLPILDICDMSALLSAMLAYEQFVGDKIEVKEKKIV